MLLRTIGLSTAILLVGCAGNNAQMQSNAALIDRLNNRIAVLESQQQALNEQIAAGGARVPSGIVAVPASRRSGVYDDTPINAAAGMASPGGSGVDMAYEQALSLYRAGDIGNAVAAFEQYLRQGGSGDPVRLNLARYWLGDAYYTQRQYEQANRFLGQYLREDPNGEKAGMALDKLISSLRAAGRSMDADILSQQGVRAIIGG